MGEREGGGGEREREREREGGREGEEEGEGGRKEKMWESSLDEFGVMNVVNLVRLETSNRLPSTHGSPIDHLLWSSTQIPFPPMHMVKLQCLPPSPHLHSHPLVHVIVWYEVHIG